MSAFKKCSPKGGRHAKICLYLAETAKKERKPGGWGGGQGREEDGQWERENREGRQGLKGGEGEQGPWNWEECKEFWITEKRERKSSVMKALFFGVSISRKQYTVWLGWFCFIRVNTIIPKDKSLTSENLISWGSVCIQGGCVTFSF